MYCKRCGTKNKDDARFCENCGQKLIEAPNTPKPEQPKQEISQEPSQEPKQPKEPKQAPKMSSKTWIIGLACIILVVVVIFGYQMMKGGTDNSRKDSASGTEEQANTENTTDNNDNTEEDTEDVKDDTEDDTDETKSHDLPYTDNDEMDLESCKNTDNYQYVTCKDKTFSFKYPKYLFNYSKINSASDEYTLGYVGDEEKEPEIIATFKCKKAQSSDPVKNVQKVYKEKKETINKVTFAYPQGGKSPQVKNGKSTMIVMGYLNGARSRCEYVLITSDGKNTYTMDIEYNETDPDDEYKEINYVVDCMYRGCSFTNSTYKLRTFEQFQKDDMGQKK